MDTVFALKGSCRAREDGDKDVGYQSLKEQVERRDSLESFEGETIYNFLLNLSLVVFIMREKFRKKDTYVLQIYSIIFNMLSNDNVVTG